jgi:hypothetical protein
MTNKPVIPAINTPTSATDSGKMTPIWYRYFKSREIFVDEEIAILTGTGLSSIYVFPEQFGAVGDGVTDDTVAMQSWLNSVLGGGPIGFLTPGKNYLISSALTGNMTTDFSIIGGSLGSTITLSSPTQNGLDINCISGRLLLRDFTIVANASASAGFALNLGGSAASTIFPVIDHITIFNAFEAVRTTGLVSIFMTRCSLTASSICLNSSTIGDSSISGNDFSPLVNATGIQLSGDCGGARITDNKINGTFLVGISARQDISDGDLFIIGNSIEGYTSIGIIFTRTAPFTFSNAMLIGNELTGSGNGISLAEDTASHWLDNVVINGNVINTSAASKVAIGIGNVPEMVISNNTIYGSAGTGIKLASGASGPVHDNVITNQTTPINNLASAVIVHDNVGYNPVGASSISPGASPYTYTAGASPETIYISDTVGITNVTYSGTSILPHATAANQPLTVEVGPLEPVVITYSGVLTGKKMIH